MNHERPWDALLTNNRKEGTFLQMIAGSFVPAELKQGIDYTRYHHYLEKGVTAVEKSKGKQGQVQHAKRGAAMKDSIPLSDNHPDHEQHLCSIVSRRKMKTAARLAEQLENALVGPALDRRSRTFPVQGNIQQNQLDNEQPERH